MTKKKRKRASSVIAVAVFLILAMTLTGILLQCAGPGSNRDKPVIRFTEEGDIIF